MTREDLRSQVLALLRQIAPEIDAHRLRGDRPLRQQADLDSMDWLHLLTALGEQFHQSIPESAHSRLSTLDSIVEYLEQGRDTAL